MKKSIILSFCTFIFFCLSATVNAQTIRRCNNNPGVSGVNVYTTIQAAHDAATAGDIIYVEPSTVSYGPLVAIKRLTIIGNGYFNNLNANNSFDTRYSQLDAVTLDNGSANSIITGIYLGGSGFNINDVNITITRCMHFGVSFGQSNNLVGGVRSRGNNATITKNFMVQGIGGNNSTTITSQYGYNCTITNNLHYSGSWSHLTNCIISNNVHYYAGGGAGLNTINGCSVTNNIYDGRGGSGTIAYVTSSGSAGNTISNNIALSLAGNVSGNGNVDFGDELNTFMVANPWNNILTNGDEKFKLKAGSPASGIGTGGTDAGIFGGSNPYILSGQPSYPIITNFLPSGVGNASTPINVSVTVRSNN